MTTDTELIEIAKQAGISAFFSETISQQQQDRFVKFAALIRQPLEERIDILNHTIRHKDADIKSLKDEIARLREALETLQILLASSGFEKSAKNIGEILALNPIDGEQK